MERRPIDDFVGKSVDGILGMNSIQKPEVFKGYSVIEYFFKDCQNAT